MRNAKEGYTQMSDHKLKWLERMAGPKDDVTEPIPLRIPTEDRKDREPLDADRFFVVVRHPTGVELDALDSLRSREVTERETVIDSLNPENSTVKEKRYYEFSAGLLMQKAVEFGLFRKGVVPDRGSDGKIAEHKLVGDLSKDWKFISDCNPVLFQSLVDALCEAIFMQEPEEQVVQEGEGSCDSSEGSIIEESQL